MRLAAFLLLFLPIVGMPALTAWAFLQLWDLVMLPVRVVRWLTTRSVARAS
jgi:hypothetical protein